MRFKPGCRLEDLKAQTVLAMAVCDGIYRGFGLEPTITSVNDSKHMARSRHYTGRAFDLRTKDVPQDHRKALFEKVRQSLGPIGFDVVWEAVGRAAEHIHVEFDPK